MVPLDPAYLSTAIRAALAAGRVHRRYFRQTPQIQQLQKKGPIDLVTAADLEAEAEFRRLIAREWPTHVVLGEDSMHWVSVAVRESVINAIKHGNKEDAHKHVTVEFLLSPRAKPEQFVVEVLDEGAGFDPDVVANPLEAENVLKSSGRGIFFMKSFMDDVTMARRPEGGMSVRMSKKLA